MADSDKPRHSPRAAIVLTVLVGAVATAIAYEATRESPRPAASPPPVGEVTSLAVETVVLPFDAPELPSGPDQRVFAESCTICHSTRLVMTQPPLSREVWGETVHKMVKNYGAPITPEAEKLIVDYLSAVHGK